MKLNKFMDLCSKLGCIIVPVDVYRNGSTFENETPRVGFVYIENSGGYVTEENVSGCWVESHMSRVIYKTPEDALKGYMENEWDQDSLNELLTK